MKEIWKDIDRYEGLYKVSSYGRINRTSFGGRILHKSNDQDGYHLVTLCKNGKKKTKKVHRIVAVAFIPNPENKPQINHKDAIKTNNYVENVEWCTAKDNTQHALRMGLIVAAKGVDSGGSKLTEYQVKQIRSTKGQMSQREIARVFGVNQSMISRILSRLNWKHI